MTREIPLSRGLVALIDEDDFDLVNSVGRWYADRNCQTFYARKNFWRNGKCLSVRMHHVITGWRYVDHANGNGLDNRRSNLRQATDQQNARNRQRLRETASGFKGVTRANSHWQAQITANGRRLYLGVFEAPEIAARAYDAAAIKYFGEFARLNFPQGEQ